MHFDAAANVEQVAWRSIGNLPLSTHVNESE
jgi:hypothetical protein